MSSHRLHTRIASVCRASFVTPAMRKLMGVGLLLGLAFVCCGTSGAWAQNSAQTATARLPELLPQGFAGLYLAAPAAIKTGADAAAIDPANAALLREDGLLDTARATYIGSGAGPGMTVRAWRFGDATGAYAAFTAYRLPQMHGETIGVEGGSLDSRYLFWTGATLVDATLTQANPHALSALRELAAALPKPRGPAAVAPPVRGYLPTDGLEAQSVHYAIGPAGYAAGGAPLPESVVDFSRDAEVVTARYHTASGTGTLTLLSYPTPQIAGSRQQAIAALLKSGAPPLTVGDPALVVERIGPLVAFTSGSFTANEAHALIRGVHLDEMITINHPEGYISEVSKAAKLLLGIAYLTGILAVAAVLLALFLGGGRVALRRMRGLPDSSMNDDDFISLKLR